MRLVREVAKSMVNRCTVKFGCKESINFDRTEMRAFALWFRHGHAGGHPRKGALPAVAAKAKAIPFSPLIYSPWRVAVDGRLRSHDGLWVGVFFNFWRHACL